MKPLYVFGETSAAARNYADAIRNTSHRLGLKPPTCHTFGVNDARSVERIRGLSIEQGQLRFTQRFHASPGAPEALAVLRTCIHRSEDTEVVI